MIMIKRIPVLFVLLLSLSITTASFAEDDPQLKADLAVANILFDYDGSSEFASYKISDSGFVDIIFATNIPEDLYVEIIDKMRAHPDISGILPSASGPSCKISNWKY